MLDSSLPLECGGRCPRRVLLSAVLDCGNLSPLPYIGPFPSCPPPPVTSRLLLFSKSGPLRQCLPYMGTALNRGSSLAGAVTRASVNKGAGLGAAARRSARGGGPAGLRCACLWTAILPAAWGRRCGKRAKGGRVRVFFGGGEVA